MTEQCSTVNHFGFLLHPPMDQLLFPLLGSGVKAISSALDFFYLKTDFFLIQCILIIVFPPFTPPISSLLLPSISTPFCLLFKKKKHRLLRDSNQHDKTKYSEMKQRRSYESWVRQPNRKKGVTRAGTRVRTQSFS